MNRSPSVVLPFIVSSLLLVACSEDDDRIPFVAPESAGCAVAAPSALAACVNAISVASGNCYAEGDAACADDHPDFLAAHQQLESDLGAACADGEFMGLDSVDLAGRLQTACQSHADALAWRTFGGPQGAVWPEVDEAGQACLQAAHDEGMQFQYDSLMLLNTCLADGDCGTAGDDRAALHSAAAANIADACPDLSTLIAVSPETYLDRSAQHVDCMTATAHEDTGDLQLRCGPSFVESLPARGEWTQIILEEEKWGSRCGDGTDYAIQIKPAPEGEPLDRVLIALQGGGVCIFEQDCRSRLDSGLFNAQDDAPLEVGIASSDADNPFANWTKVYLPYCDQAVFTGGGVVEQFSDFEVNRFGSINLRAGVQAARDIVWSMLDAEGGRGYRPDEVVALFGGFSAGGYGTIYNYHFMLDDLLWPRTIAFPDAGGALDNGGVGVRTLGDLKIPEWGVVEYLPPYCFTGECAVGPTIYRAFAPRLRQVPEQQLLVLSNQKDNTQQRDAFFTDEAQWINAMRAAYCDTKDLNGIHWYLTSESQESVHVVSIRDEFYYGEVAGERMVDWFDRAVNDPDSLSDFAEEGTFVDDIPGSLPFPCDLP